MAAEILMAYSYRDPPVMQLVFLSHFLQHNSLWTLSTNQKMQIWIFEAELWDDPTEKINTLTE